MKRGLGIRVLGILLALCFQVPVVSPVFASMAQVNTAAGSGVAGQTHEEGLATATDSRPKRARHTSSGKFRQNNQYFSGDSNSGNSATIRGHNQANTGNRGSNFGRNWDNAVNGGNQIIHTNKSNAYWQNNQYFFGRSNTRNSFNAKGYNQGNSGNQGYNLGDNQDNTRNSGNQLID